MYVAMEGLLSADAAPLRLRFSESLKGEVPIVVPAVFERTCVRQCRCSNVLQVPKSRTLWKVQNTGLELNA